MKTGGQPGQNGYGRPPAVWLSGKSYGYGFYENAADVQKRTADALAGYILPAVKPDADNLAKAALDACNGIIWRDDALICSLLVKSVMPHTRVWKSRWCRRKRRCLEGEQ